MCVGNDSGRACSVELRAAPLELRVRPPRSAAAAQDKKEEKAWSARAKRGDKELRAAGKQLDAAQAHAAKHGVGGGGTGRPGPEPALPTSQGPDTQLQSVVCIGAGGDGATQGGHPAFGQQLGRMPCHASMAPPHETAVLT